VLVLSIESMLQFIDCAREHEVYRNLIVRGEDLQVINCLLKAMPEMEDVSSQVDQALTAIWAVLAFTKDPDFIMAHELSSFARTLNQATYEGQLRTLQTDSEVIKALKDRVKLSLDEIKRNAEHKSQSSPEKRYQTSNTEY